MCRKTLDTGFGCLQGLRASLNVEIFGGGMGGPWFPDAGARQNRRAGAVVGATGIFACSQGADKTPTTSVDSEGLKMSVQSP
mmetsp:Transcript_17862/g.71731  ORF Transcript_17862/g.71731 Transcript_17862/m.71731 type:complete len:82 (+) Transcript_17862:570-815(+)